MAVSTYFNRVKYIPVSAGTVDFVTSAAVTGFRTPADASVGNGAIVSYVAFNSTQTEWETGQGTYTSGTTTLARTTVRESSNAGAKVNFTAAPTVALDLQAQDITNLPPVAINGATLGANALAVMGTSAFGGRISVPQGGSNASPTIFNASETNTGISFSAAQTILITTGGSQRADFNASVGGYWFFGGNGTYSPNFQLSTVGGVINWNADTTISRNAAGVIQFGTTAANALGSILAMAGAFTGRLTNLGGAAFIATNTALTDGVGASAGTITNAPSIGNPTKWIGINDNGTTRYIPAW